MPYMFPLSKLFVLVMCISTLSARCHAMGSGGGIVDDPVKYGVSKEGLEKIRTEFAKAVANGELAGGVGIFARHGKIVFHEGLGMKDREAGVPMRTDTIFHIASLTKIVTSVAAMILVEEGKIDLDAPVSRYLPNFAGLKVLEADGDGWKEVEPRRQMTVRRLFSHTAGLTYGWNAQDRADQLLYEKEVTKDNKTIADMVNKMDRVPLKHHPGEIWEYSLATDVLGRVIEVTSGMPLDEFFRKRIFRPLKMKDTGFEVPKGKLRRLAAMYKRDADGKTVRTEDNWLHKNGKPTYQSGGGGLSSTARDYYAIMAMLLNEGEFEGKRILKKESVTAMRKNEIPGLRISTWTPWVGEKGFGLGLAIYDAPLKKGVCYGWNGATGTMGWVNPEKEMAGVFMIHLGVHDPANLFRQLAHEALTD